MERARNLLAVAGPDLTNHFLDRLQVKELELEQLSWGKLTGELMKTDRAILDRRKTIGFLTPSPLCTHPPEHKHGRRGDGPAAPAKTADDPEGEDCWNHIFMGTCDYTTCSRNHPGPPGAKKHKLATPDGNCRRFLEGTCERGDGCKFKHEQEPKPNDPERRHREEILARNKAAREAGHQVF
jgi:hypothetical protein